MPTRITLKAVNEELARNGFKATLAKGDGYFCFTSGEAADWLESTVRVPTLSNLSLADWVGEFRRLRDLNGQLGKAPPNRRNSVSSGVVREQTGAASSKLHISCFSLAPVVSLFLFI